MNLLDKDLTRVDSVGVIASAKFGTGDYASDDQIREKLHRIEEMARNGDIIIPKYAQDTEVWVVDDTKYHGYVIGYTQHGEVYVQIGQEDSNFGAYSNELVFDKEEDADACLAERNKTTA